MGGELNQIELLEDSGQRTMDLTYILMELPRKCVEKGLHGDMGEHRKTS